MSELSIEELEAVIMPKSFDDMDTNHDGVVTRSEYDDAMR